MCIVNACKFHSLGEFIGQTIKHLRNKQTKINLQPIRDSIGRVERLIDSLRPFTEYTFEVTTTFMGKESAVARDEAKTETGGKICTSNPESSKIFKP